MGAASGGMVLTPTSALASFTDELAVLLVLELVEVLLDVESLLEVPAFMLALGLGLGLGAGLWA